LLFALKSIENVQFLMVGLVVHKVTTGLSANQLNLLNGAIRNSGRKPNTLAGAVPTLCARKVTTEYHTCRHIVSKCVTVNKNESCRPYLVGNWCQAFEGVFAVSMRQLLQHICLTYNLGAVMQADSSALSTHGCDAYQLLLLILIS
jgi:hypothetical protein